MHVHMHTSDMLVSKQVSNLLFKHGVPFRYIVKVQKTLPTPTKKRLTCSIKIIEAALQGCHLLDDLTLHQCVHPS